MIIINFYLANFTYGAEYNNDGCNCFALLSCITNFNSFSCYYYNVNLKLFITKKLDFCYILSLLSFSSLNYAFFSLHSTF